MATVTVVEIPYRPRPLQAEIHAIIDSHRFSAFVCHRRFGKTVAAVNHLQRAAIECPKPRPRFAYLAPTYRQGKAIAWDYMKHYAAPMPGHAVNESELRVDYPTGGQVRIYGADNPDSLRGLYLDGVIADEYGLQPPNIFTEVLRPALSDRNGWAAFMGTPNGKNQFYEVVQTAQRDPGWGFGEYKASQTGVLPIDELRAAQSVMTADEYAQEYECSFEASVKGAVYAREVATARDQGRVTRVPIDPAMPVDTDWDLGVGDATAIWFSQTLYSGEVRLVDYYEASGLGLDHYKAVLNEKGYAYGMHWAPHDIQVRELGSGRSRLEAAHALGLPFQISPRVESLEDGIHAARMLFPRCWFDADRTRHGLEALQHYRWDYNARIHEFKPVPIHDWSSHAADAFRGLAYRHYTPKFNPERQAAVALRKAQRDVDPYDLRFQRRSGRAGY
jgi:phage terminase large subunit